MRDQLLNRGEQVDKAIKEFPGEFGLRGYPGDCFRVSSSASYWSDYLHEPAIYLQVNRGEDLGWVDFGKGTVTEIREEIIR